MQWVVVLLAVVFLSISDTLAYTAADCLICHVPGYLLQYPRGPLGCCPVHHLHTATSTSQSSLSLLLGAVAISL